MVVKRKRHLSNTTVKRRKTIKTSSSALILKDPSRTTIVQRSALLSLPGEILTHILSFLLARHDGDPILLRSANERRWRNEISKLVDIECTNHWRGPPHYNSAVKAVSSATKSKLLKSLLVCRDFYFAGVAAFYGGNTFKFESTANLARLSTKLDIDRRRHISSVLIARDINGDHKELIAPGAWSEAHDPVALNAAMERLPALNQIILDFKMGGLGPPFLWGRLRTHINTLKDSFAAISDKVSFAVDGKASDPEKWAVAK